MASTNKTTNYELSQFQSSDIPAWLTDYNGDMQKIDAGIHAAKVQAEGAASGVSALQTAVSGKQDRLTFDSAPISGSSNPVTSGGIYEALQNVSVQTDAVPTAGSTKAVQSGGVYTALAGKQNTLTFDSTPAQGSTNPVTSGGVYSALANLVGAEVPVLNAAGGYARTYNARAIKIGGMLIFAQGSSSRAGTAKNNFSQIGTRAFYAYTNTTYAIQGNPLSLSPYSENSSEWLNSSERQSFTTALLDTNDDVIGDVVISLRYDGSNTRIVYVISTETYNAITTVNVRAANSLFGVFLSAENQ